MFVCIDVGVAAASVVFAMEGMLFVCMDVGCILMPGSTNFNDISSPLWMVRTLGNSYRVAAAYVCFVMEGIMFVCMDVGVAAAYVMFVLEGIMFVCLDVGCILMPGSTNFNDISSPLWMVRTPGNSVGVAIS